MSSLPAENHDHLEDTWSSQLDSFFDYRIDSTLSDEIAQATPEPDFVTLISAVSRMYSRRRYLDMADLDLTQDERQVSPLGKGAVFVVKSFSVKYSVPSKLQLGELETVENDVVSKNTPTLFDVDGSCLDPARLRGLVMEVRILSHGPLYWHPNIITMIGVGWHFEHSLSQPTAQPRLVLELAEGTLDDFIGNHQDLPFMTRCEIGLGISNGLAALHTCGIVHGDVKPTNILMVPDYSAEDVLQGSSGYTPKIADFSHSFVDDLGPRRMSGGTPGYTAPEILAGGVIEDCKATDIYSLGVTLWRLAISDIPFPRGGSVAGGEDTVLAAVTAAVSTRFEASTAASSRKRILLAIMNRTVTSDPAARDLEAVKGSLLQFCDDPETGHSELQYRRIFHNTKLWNNLPKHAVNNSEICINYQALNTTSYVVKDQLVRRLQYISQDDNDPRQARSLFELGICHIASFGDPNLLEISQGLKFVLQSAQSGDLAARGYAWRLLRSFDGVQTLASQWEQQAWEWLCQAAAEGHEAAFHDFTHGYADAARKKDILELRLSDSFKVMPSQGLDEFKAQVRGPLCIYGLEQHQLLFHWAAQLNLLGHVEFLLKDLSVEVDCQDSQGNTALIMSCRAGQLDSSILLIELGADVNRTNISGETGLHYLWKFDDRDAKLLLSKFVGKGVEFSREADFHALPQPSTEGRGTSLTATELDPLPILDGLAIERAAARGRIELVREFLRLGGPVTPVNGNTIRRMLLWSSRLGFHDIRELLVGYSRGEFAQFHDVSACEFNDELGDIEDAEWELDNEVSGLMTAVAVGWVSVRSFGWHTPEAFWRICCHGRQWESRLRDTINSMMATTEKCLCDMENENALVESLNRRHHQFMRVFLRAYLAAHQNISANGQHEEGNTYDPPIGACQMDTTSSQPEELGCGFDYGALDPIYSKDSHTQNPPKRAPLIDTILWKQDSTLVQYAIIKGDRVGFRMLAEEFGADVRRPWSAADPRELYNEEPVKGVRIVPDSGEIYLNCYSLLALHSKDIWFAHEFKRLGINPDHLGIPENSEARVDAERRYKPGTVVTSRPKDGNFYGNFENLPPLFFSMAQGFYHLTIFLLDNGAKFEEPVTATQNVLNRVLSLDVLRQESAQFLFSQRGRYPSMDGSQQSISLRLLPPCLFTDKGGRGVFELLHSSVVEHEAIASTITDYALREPLARARLFAGSKRIYLSIKGAALVPVRAFHYLTHAWVSAIVPPPDMKDILKARSCPEEISDASISILCTVWNDLLDAYSNVRSDSRWHRKGGLFPTRSASLIELTLTLANGIDPRKLLYSGVFRGWPDHGRSNVDQNPLECSGDSLCSKLQHSEVLYDDPNDRHFLMQSSLVELLERNPPSPHEPHILDILIFNEFDLMRPHSPEYDILYNLGYRHSIVHFHEILIGPTYFLIVFIPAGNIFILVLTIALGNGITAACVVPLIIFLGGYIEALLLMFFLPNLRYALRGGNRIRRPYDGYSWKQFIRALRQSFSRRTKEKTEVDVELGDIRHHNRT